MKANEILESFSAIVKLLAILFSPIKEKNMKSKASKANFLAFVEELKFLIETDYEIKRIMKELLENENNPIELGIYSASVNALLKRDILIEIQNYPRNMPDVTGYTVLASYRTNISDYKLKQQVYDYIKKSKEIKKILDE